MKRFWKHVLVAGAVVAGSVVLVEAHVSATQWSHYHLATSSSACYYGCQIVNHSQTQFCNGSCRCRN